MYVVYYICSSSSQMYYIQQTTDDDNRVKLKPMAGRADCQHEYINASYVDGYFMTNKFIATQGIILLYTCTLIVTVYNMC